MQIRFLLLITFWISCESAQAYCRYYQVPKVPLQETIGREFERSEKTGCVAIMSEHLNGFGLRDKVPREISISWVDSGNKDVWYRMFFSYDPESCENYCRRMAEYLGLTCPRRGSVVNLDEALKELGPLREELGLIAEESSPSFATKNHTRDELLDNIVAVHATQYFPKGAKISIARQTSPGAGFRPKIHFNLGGLVKAHIGGNWNQSPLAILSPLRAMTDTLVNINPKDTTILGDFRIPRGATIVADTQKFSKSDFEKEEFSGINLVYFNSAEKPLRDVVRETLENQGKWIFQDHNGNPHPRLFDARFYAPILKDLKSVTFSPVSEHISQFGQNGLYGQLDWNLMALRTNPTFPTFASGPKTTREMEFLIFSIERDLAHLEAKVAKSYYPAETRENFSIAQKDAQSWLRLAKAELFLRKQGKSLYLSDSDTLDTFYDLRHRPRDFEELLHSQMAHFQDYSIATERPFDYRLAQKVLVTKVQNSESEKVAELIQNFPDVFQGQISMEAPKISRLEFRIGKRPFSYRSDSGYFLQKNETHWCITQAGYENMIREKWFLKGLIRVGDCLKANPVELPPSETKNRFEHL